MKNAGIVIGIISLIAVVAVGLMLNTSLRSYSDSQADLRADQKKISSSLSELKDSLGNIEGRLTEIETASNPSYDSDISRIRSDLADINKRLEDLEKGGVTSASGSEGSAANGRGMRGGFGEFGGMLGEDDENLTEEEKAARDEERTKAFRNIARGFATEGMKMMKKATENRLAKAVQKLSLSAGQESQMKTAIDEAMEKARDLIDRAIEGEDVSEEFRKLRDETDAQAKEILTEEQYKEWQKSDPMRGGGMRMGMGGGGMWGRGRGDSNRNSDSGKNQ
ncbi:MAG: hypothetical protein ACYS8W_15695 [Planctomycetota bacterium]|jgi:hypothetical protein